MTNRKGLVELSFVDNIEDYSNEKTLPLMQRIYAPSRHQTTCRAFKCGGLPRSLTLLVCACLFSFAATSAFGYERWDFWLPSQSESSQIVDHSQWQGFLDDYLSLDTDTISRVAYDDARATDGARRLQDYLEHLARIDPRSLNRTEQMAYWINLYNALTVQVVLAHPGKKSIRRMGQGWFSLGPWDDKLITIAGQAVTLNDIEHRILRHIWQDRRIHFAVNCASLGCPNLAAQAYRSENLQLLLDAGQKQYINHPRGVSFDDKGQLTVSSIFEWYQADFADNKSELLAYLADHHTTLSDQIRSYSGKINFAYNWQLNNAEKISKQ